MPEPRLIAALLQRNESHRYLRSAFSAWSTFANEIIVVDDMSDDDSWIVAREQPKVTTLYSLEHDTYAWGNESQPRAKLWELAMERAKHNDWIIVLDADMVPARSPRALMHASDRIDAWAFSLYDLWGTRDDGTLLYREDAFWQGHMHPRIWMTRVPDLPPLEGYKWNARGIHCGHLPENVKIKRMSVAPLEYSLLHYAYHDGELRKEKYEKYMEVDSMLTTPERLHYKSILDEAPALKPLPFAPELTLERKGHAYAI